MIMSGKNRYLAGLLCGFLLGQVAMSSAEEIRVFRSSTGHPLKAKFEGLNGEIVKLRREDGKVFELTKDKLSAEDQAYVTAAGAKVETEVKALNAAAGHAIAGQESLTSRNAEEFAKALKLPAESQSKYGRSWRLYAAFAKNYLLFGAMPYSVALYSGEDGLATSLSVVYANKGDFGSTAGFGKDHFNGGTATGPSTLAAAMTKDEETVSKAITSVLGEGKTLRYGEGKTRRKVVRWDWNGYSFLLSNVEGEYVGLSIVSTETANAGGKSTVMKEDQLKKRLIESVVKKENGDVYLTEIPMVDQGPKGYCVPATFERAMRTMGIDADMYLLAMIGQSTAGGGTSVTLMLDNVRSQVYNKGRRPKDEDVKELRIRDVKRYIDQGIPVMWSLCSMDSYNEVADGNSKARSSVQDWAAYAAEIAEKSKMYLEEPKPDDNYHICMIIGYNEATNEFAVSDSWGKNFELRWVPVPVANWANAGHIFMILP